MTQRVRPGEFTQVIGQGTAHGGPFPGDQTGGRCTGIPSWVIRWGTVHGAPFPGNHVGGRGTGVLSRVIRQEGHTGVLSRLKVRFPSGNEFSPQLLFTLEDYRRKGHQHVLLCECQD